MGLSGLSSGGRSGSSGDSLTIYCSKSYKILNTIRYLSLTSMAVVGPWVVIEPLSSMEKVPNASRTSSSGIGFGFPRYWPIWLGRFPSFLSLNKGWGSGETVAWSAFKASSNKKFQFLSSAIVSCSSTMIVLRDLYEKDVGQCKHTEQWFSYRAPLSNVPGFMCGTTRQRFFFHKEEAKNVPSGHIAEQPRRLQL